MIIIKKKDTESDYLTVVEKDWVDLYSYIVYL